jgi:hypothetical protein
MKQWNIGNTTLRNPNRIQDGLKLLKEFEGKSWDYELQVKFYDEANKRGIMESEGEKVKDGGKELHARKWVSCLNQLGFARAWKDKEKGPVEITEVGNQLVNDEITFEEAMLRQLLKYQLPSVIESGKNYEEFKVHPFRVFLGVIYGLSEQGISGLTKEEIGMYVITTLRDEKIQDTVRKIAKYRTERNSIKGNNPKLDYFRSKLEEVIADIFSEDISQAKKVISDLLAATKKSKGFLKSSDFENELKLNKLYNLSEFGFSQHYKMQHLWQIIDYDYYDDEDIYAKVEIVAKRNGMNTFLKSYTDKFIKAKLINLTNVALSSKNNDLSAWKKLRAEAIAQYEILKQETLKNDLKLNQDSFKKQEWGRDKWRHANGM